MSNISVEELLYPENNTFMEILPKIIPNFDKILFFVKAVGILFIIYFIYIIVKGFFGIRRNRRIDKMYNKVNEIDRKIDLIFQKLHLKNSEVKEDEKKSKKKSREKK
jgi:hypothetical protein